MNSNSNNIGKNMKNIIDMVDRRILTQFAHVSTVCWFTELLQYVCSTEYTGATGARMVSQSRRPVRVTDESSFLLTHTIHTPLALCIIVTSGHIDAVEENIS